MPNPFPQKIVLAKPSPHFAPPPARILGGQKPRKKKHPFLFQKKFHPRQIRNARSVFSFGVSAESARRKWRGIRRAYDLGQSHHALRACTVSRYHRGCFQNTFELCTMNTAHKSANVRKRGRSFSSKSVTQI